MSTCILVVDDEAAIRESLCGLLEDEMYIVEEAASGEEAVARLRQTSCDCVLLDIWLPGIDGLETLARLRKLNADIPIIMMSGHATIETAIKATRNGAFDLIEKPLSTERILILIRNALEQQRLARENNRLRQEKVDNTDNNQCYTLIGQSTAIKMVRHMIKRVAPNKSPILLLGEYGAGKLVTARMIHQQSPRQHQPFVELPCANLDELRLDDLLFGSETTAITDDSMTTGHMQIHTGYIEQASGGVLFLDEITDLSSIAQSRLVQVIQHQSIRRVGSISDIPVDVRMIAASRYAPRESLKRQSLREDLYYKLSVIPIYLPPLRNRMDDFAELMTKIISKHAKRLGVQEVCFSVTAINQLQTYTWPGNVRELHNYLERCQILLAGQEITAENMPPLDSSQGRYRFSHDAKGYYATRDAFERGYFLHYLEKNDWNISKTSQIIGVERSQLYRKIRAIGLQREKHKSDDISDKDIT
ncbi:MAG: sigma-54 dependent transcriptional regulator [Mariprofundales bacterium]